MIFTLMLGGLFSGGVAAQSLPIDGGWVAPVGSAKLEDGAIALRGEPGVEQAVLLFAPVDIDADAAPYVTIEHDGLAPLHQLSLYFRAADGEHTIDLPSTRGAVTARLSAENGWRGRITELALVYGPAGNVPTGLADDTLRIRGIEFAPDSPGASLAAFRSREFQTFDFRGRSNNVQPATALSVWFGMAAAIALAIAVFGGARGRKLGRIAFATVFALWLAVAFRQWFVLRESSEAVSDARRASNRALELDADLADVAKRVKSALAGREDEVSFVITHADEYVAERMRFHLLPFRARYRQPEAWLVGEHCVFAVDGDPESPSPHRADTPFGPVVFNVASRNPDACRSYSLPRLR